MRRNKLWRLATEVLASWRKDPWDRGGGRIAKVWDQEIIEYHKHRNFGSLLSFVSLRSAGRRRELFHSPHLDLLWWSPTGDDGRWGSHWFHTFEAQNKTSRVDLHDTTHSLWTGFKFPPTSTFLMTFQPKTNHGTTILLLYSSVFFRVKRSGAIRIKGPAHGPPLQEACLKLLRSHVLHHAAAWTYKEINEQDLNAKVSCGKDSHWSWTEVCVVCPCVLITQFSPTSK